MARRNRAFWESNSLNARTFQQYYNRLMELSISCFEWENLPETVDPRFLELILFSDGHAVFFRDDVIGELALRVMPESRLDLYHIPTDRMAIGENGYRKELTNKDSVMIYNNLIHTNALQDVEMFARRLYELDRTIDINVKAQKTPILIACDEDMLLTLKNAYKKYEGNEPVIIGDKKINKDALQTLTTGAPYVSDRLYTLKTQIWNEALTYLGIPNITTTKKERMISDEVERAQGGTIASRYSRLVARQQAAEQINKMFDLNVSVRYREGFQSEDSTEGGEVE